MTSNQFLLMYTLTHLYNFKLVDNRTYSNSYYTIKLGKDDCHYLYLNGEEIKLNSVSEYKKYIRTDKLNKLINGL